MKKTILLMAIVATCAWRSASAQTSSATSDSVNVQSQMGISLDCYIRSQQFGTINLSTFGKREGKNAVYSNIGYSPIVSTFNANFGIAIPFKSKSYKFFDLGINVNTDYISKDSPAKNRYSYYGFEGGLRWQHLDKKAFFYRLTLGVGYKEYGYKLDDPINGLNYSGLGVNAGFTIGYAFSSKSVKVKVKSKK